ncbi:MAG: GGDEF domain-containing protein [Actinobacteria bacterium]|nr:GGDEF domain-containing protein [Actinomycetota bacterium]
MLRFPSWARVDAPAFVAGGILLLAFAVCGLDTRSTDWTLVAADAAAAVFVVAAAAILPLPASALVLLPFACDAVVAVLRQAQGGSTSGYGPLAALPAVWVGLQWGGRAVPAMTAATAAMFGLPIALVGAPMYPNTGWRGVVLWTIVSALIGGGASRVMRAQRAHAHDLDRLVGIQNSIATSAFEVEAVMRTVVENALELTGAEAAVVEIPDGDDMVYRAAAGTAVSHLGRRVPRARSLSGLAIATAEMLVCTDSELDPRVDRDACRHVGARSLIVVPLPHEGSPTGVLKVYSPVANAFGDGAGRVLAMLSSMIAAALARADLLRQLGKQATTDSLTGLLNRSGFHAELSLALARARRSGLPLSVVVLDVDGLKQVNDTKGHAEGDRLLRELASRWSAAVRITDVIGRTGGDEFALVLEGTDAEGVATVSVALQEALRPGHAASSGCATWDGEETADALLARADAAMYAMKRSRSGLAASA